jgi:hypothetical protein
LNIATFNRRLLVLFLVLLGIVVALIVMARSSSEEQVDSWDTDYAPTTEKRQYNLSDSSNAVRMNVTVVREGDVNLFLGWSESSEEMTAFVEAVSGATPVDGTTDETFTNLIVFFFSDGDSFSATYSRDRELLMFNEQLYSPAGEITPLIVSGEERYN